MNLSILGTKYEIIRRNYTDDSFFEKGECVAYCDKMEKQVVLCNAKTHPSYKDDTEASCAKVEKVNLRHEIVHAFLCESGLDSNSGRITNIGWAENEEMIDWIALQAPKLIAAFTAVDAL